MATTQDARPDADLPGARQIAEIASIAERWMSTRTADAHRLLRLSGEIEECLSAEPVTGMDLRFRAMADSAPVLLWMAGTDSLCTFFNHTWLEFTGRSMEQEIGVGWAEGVHPVDFQSCMDTFMAAFASRRPFEMSYRLRRHDGEYRWILDRGVPRFAASGAFAGYIGSCVDITDIRTAHEERERLLAQHLQAQKLESLGVLAGGIAHDFNNLLTGILGNASLALMDMAHDHPAAPAARLIVEAAERAAALTNQMLAYSGKGIFEMRMIDIGDEVRRLSALLAASVPKHVRLETHVVPDLPFVHADPVQIQQLVLNLVTNAAEAHGHRSGTVDIRVRLEDLDARALAMLSVNENVSPGLHVVLEVEDQGCGMDAATLSRMFEPFFTTKFTGRGLGLAAVLGIVRGHAGAMSVKSAPGAGTIFRIYLPASTVVHPTRREERAAPAAASGSAREAPGSLGTVLVVDDEAIVRGFAKAVLERAGLRVIMAEDGREAVELFRARVEEIGVVLLDMTMPEMSGEATFRALRELRPDVRVILSSGYTEVAVARQFTATGLAGFVQKPYAAAQLIAKIRAVLAAS
jgi:PAS domain S-box-containing protein